MSLTWTRLAIALALLTFSAGAAALADDPPAKSDEASAGDVSLAKKAIAKTKITLGQAVEIALKRAPGKAVECRLYIDGDEVEYVVEIRAGDKHKDVAIDPAAGTVKDVDDVSPEDLKSEPEGLKAETAAAAAPTSLSHAIAIAIKEFPGGKCLEAVPKIKKKSSKLIWEVDLLVGEKIKEVDIDAANGAVLKVKDE
jgi:uncharacterized membrane protein YkoI